VVKEDEKSAVPNKTTNSLNLQSRGLGIKAECFAIELLRNNRSRQRRISPLKRTIFIATGLASLFVFTSPSCFGCMS